VRAFVLGFDRAARFQFEQPMDMSGHSFRDIDPPCYSERFHEPRGVDRIAPDIERHPAVTDDTGNDRASMDADAQLHGIFSNRFASRL
jgi:hypothetical protein